MVALLANGPLLLPRQDGGGLAAEASGRVTVMTDLATPVAQGAVIIDPASGTIGARQGGA